MRMADATNNVATPAGGVGAKAIIPSKNARRGKLYLLDAAGQPVATSVWLGITDGSSTELLEPPAVLHDGTAVITGNPATGAVKAAPKVPF